MKTVLRIKKILTICFGILTLAACDEQLTELNQNPNGLDPETANPNMIMPAVLGPAAQNYLNLGFGNIAGVMQHTQKDGWFEGHNNYDWNAQEWTDWYGLLRNNTLMYDRAVALDWKFHQGVAKTMKGFIFGTITDFWGNAPYTDALKGDEGALNYEFPEFDNQEVIYEGVIDDLREAVSLFAEADDNGISEASDLYYGGNTESWRQFANSLLIRYYMRISEKNPAVARSGLEAVVSSGVYIKNPADDATLEYTGGGSDIWPSEYAGDNGTSFRNLKPCQTLVDQLRATNDPRMSVWFATVHCQWVANPTLTTEVDEFIRKDGEIQTGVTSLTDLNYVEEIAAGHVFTRHYNPNTFGGTIDNNEIVGLPPGLMQPSSYNLNPTPGQVLENQHISQLAGIYRQGGGDLLKARLISAAEISFTLAEAALNGWSVGDAQAHYESAIRFSLENWGVEDQYDTFMAEGGVAFDGTLEQIMEQKWVASWTSASEAWFDWRRTGLPSLAPGPASIQPVLPVRFNYGSDEINNNEANYREALNSLEITPYSGPRENDSQWSKTWLLQGTGYPW